MRFKAVILLGYIWIANAQVLRIVPFGSKLRPRRFGDRLPTPLRPTIFSSYNFPDEVEIKPRNQFRNSYRPAARYPQVTTTAQPYTTEGPETTPFTEYELASLSPTPLPSDAPTFRPSASPFTFPSFSYSALPSKTYASLTRPLATFAPIDVPSESPTQNPLSTVDPTFSPSSSPFVFKSSFPTLPTYAPISRPLSSLNYRNPPIRPLYQRPLTYQRTQPTYAPIPVPVEPFSTSSPEPLTYSRPLPTFAPTSVPVERFITSSPQPLSYSRPLSTFAPTHVPAEGYAPLSRLYHRRPAQRVYDAEDYGPAYYTFRYSVNAPETGDFKEQEETRENDVVRGSYSFVQPDGRRRIVKYTADDQNGFNALVSYEDAGPLPSATGPSDRYFASRRV